MHYIYNDVDISALVSRVVSFFFCFAFCGVVILKS